jgi:hypothetical protein
MVSLLQALQERKMKRLSLLTLVITQFLSADVVSTVYVPHLADGGGWKTVFTIVNLSGIQADGTLRFHAEDGSPLPLLTVGSTIGPASSLLISVPANGIVVIETTGTTTATALGWAELIVSASNSLAVSTIFRQHVAQHPDFEASVVASPVIAKPLTFPFDHSSGAATGIALTNESTVNNGTIAVAIRDESGQMLQVDNITLGPGSHLSFSLNSRYPSLTGQRGTIMFSPDYLTSLGAVAFRFNPTGPFTTLAPLVR